MATERNDGEILRTTLSVKRAVVFTFLALVVTSVSIALRVPRLAARPMHADEAVHTVRFRQLWQERNYKYDPDEYHGPTLPYATLPVIWSAGPREFAETTSTMYRSVPVIFGVLLVVLMMLWADGLGKAAVLYASLLTAVSPAMVYYSRYYIHETLLIFFTFAAFACLWRYVRSGRVAWCLMGGVAVGLVQATKETSVLGFAAAAGAVVIVWACSRRVLPSTVDSTDKGTGSAFAPHAATCKSADISWRQLGVHVALATSVAALTAVTLLSSLYENPRGAIDGFLTYLPWLERAGGQTAHVHPWYFYLRILTFWHVKDGPWWSEAAIVALGLIGILVAWWPGADRLRHGMHRDLLRWTACYTLLLTAAYSLIPYKTPWCLLGFLHGLILLAGVGAVALWRLTRHWPLQIVVGLALLVAPLHLAWQTSRAIGDFAADPRNPYVYAHTLPDIQRLEDDLQQLLQASPEGPQTTVKVIWQDGYYWPLPWYLRRFAAVGYWTELPTDPAAPLVLCSPEFDAPLTAELEATHLMTGYYGIRPGVLAMLWVRMDVWEAHLRRLGRL
jgi:uncharacterized protein (TIGR03663 family)